MQARFAMLMLLPLMVSTASDTDIYKCTGKNGSVSYADTPCPNQQATLLHKETKAEAAEAKQSRIANTIYRMLDNGQFEQARDFAAANGATALFQDRVQANVRRLAPGARRKSATGKRPRMPNKNARCRPKRRPGTNKQCKKSRTSWWRRTPRKKSFAKSTGVR